MTSYKIHSLKNSEKLSFIIEWEDEKVLTQKLGAEWHIILSVQKIEAPTENLFCFEWKKSDGAFIEGKISADNIFLAYEILKNEYKYTITKLYPESVVETEKQEKILSELLATFQETTTKEPKIITDTSKQTLEKYKKILLKLTEILQKDPKVENESIITELKKIDQNNNATIIQQELKRLLKGFWRKRDNTVFFDQIRPLMKEMKVFVMPDILFNLITKIVHAFKFLDPIIHPREINTQRHVSVENLSEEAVKEALRVEYESIHNNSHIHTFLKKKYRKGFSDLWKETNKKYYLYTLFREKKSVLIIKRILKNFQKITTTAILLVVLLTCIMVFLWSYSVLFVSSKTLMVFLILLTSSLVIRSETV